MNRITTPLFASLLAVSPLAAYADTALQTSAAEKDFTNSIGMEFALIPAGEFMIGTDCVPKATPGCQRNETPQHDVPITEPFYLGKYEVTQAQWQKVMGENPSNFTKEKVGEDSQNYPVEQISWDDAQAFVQKMNAQENCADCYRLPTEAEWEYAARASTATVYYFGDDSAELNQYAWINENAEQKTHSVGQKSPNAWGLYDMMGNVLEWTASECSHYVDMPGIETQASCASNAQACVVRGGSWSTYAHNTRSANRFNGAPDIRSNFVGLRLARSVAPTTP